MHLFGLGWILLMIRLDYFLLLLTLLIISLAGCSRNLALERTLNRTVADQNTQVPRVSVGVTEAHDNSEKDIVTSLDNIIVVGDVDSYPDSCNPREVVTLILRFFEAYNEGDQEQLAQFFDEWLTAGGVNGRYSDTIVRGLTSEEWQHFATSNREEILAYVARRYDQNESLQLLSLGVGPSYSSTTRVDVTYTYMRQADDIQPGPNGVGRMGDGKGAIRCPSQKIGVWSFGTAASWEEEDDYLYACNGSRIDSVSAKIIVCGKLETEK